MNIVMMYKYGLLLGFFFIVFQACLRPVDGCVHPRAKDFNPEADRNTTCDFYDIYYDFEHIYSDSTVMTDSMLIIDKDNNQYFIDQLQFFLFQSHLSKSDASSFSSISDITYQENGSTKYLEDNIALFSFRQNSAQACDWTHLGTFDSLDFQIGIPSTIQEYNFVGLDASHEFNTSSPLYDQNRLVSARIVLIDAISNDTVEVLTDYFLPYKTSINRTVADGMDLRLNCQLNYDSLLYNISIPNDASSLIGQSIIQNIHNSLTIE